MSAKIKCGVTYVSSKGSRWSGTVLEVLGGGYLLVSVVRVSCIMDNPAEEEIRIVHVARAAEYEWRFYMGAAAKNELVKWRASWLEWAKFREKILSEKAQAAARHDSE